MNRAITSALAALALTLAIAVPALAAPSYVLVDISVTCQSDDGPIVERVPDAPPGQARQAIAEWFRTTDCDPGTRDLSFETRPVTFGSICAGLGGIVDDSAILRLHEAQVERIQTGVVGLPVPLQRTGRLDLGH